MVETISEQERKYVFERVVTSSGRYVFRVHFEHSMLSSRDETVDKLRAMGALWEWSSASLLAVDARDAVHGQQLADFLFHRENLGLLIYETGKS